MSKFGLAATCLLFLTVFAGQALAQEKKDSGCAQDLLLRFKWSPEDTPGVFRFPAPGVTEEKYATSSVMADPKSSVTPKSLGIKGISVATSCPNGIPSFRIYLITGRKLGSPEDIVLERSVKAGDKFVVNEFSRFGIIPWEIEAISASRKPSFLPSIASESVSIAGSVEPVSATLPTVKFIAKNNSKKPVIGLDVEMRTGDELRANLQIRNWQNLPFIMPDQSYSGDLLIYFERGADLSPEKLGDLQTNEVIIIKAAVFEDGSVEGDEAAAWKIKAKNFGDRLQVENAIAALEKVAASKSITVERIEASLENLTRSIGPERLVEIVSRSGLVDPDQILRIKGLASSSFGVTRLSFIKDLDQFKATNNGVHTNGEIERWLESKLAEYRKWSARLVY